MLAGNVVFVRKELRAMKKAFICALLAGFLVSVCAAQQNTASAKPVALKQVASQPAFGPVLLPNSGRHVSTTPNLTAAAQQSAVRPSMAVARQESLGEIARRYRAEKLKHPSHAVLEAGLQ